MGRSLVSSVYQVASRKIDRNIDTSKLTKEDYQALKKILHEAVLEASRKTFYSNL